MNTSLASDDNQQTGPPLWPISLVVVIILVVPVALYSLAPTGPLREGDTIFSHGEQRVLLTKSVADSELRDTCLLDPGNPLIIIQRPADRPDGHLLAQVQGNPAIEWPFCPPHAEVLLTEHQIYQKPDILSEVQKILSDLFGR